MTCRDCIRYKIYRGSRDRYGLQLEPDVADCTGRPTDDEYNEFFCNASERAEDCSWFKSKYKEDME